jgi:raffinose/stachyose/melibiose transport system permease protein
MTHRREQAMAFTILGVFSLVAVLPIVGIVITALQEPGGLESYGSFDGFHFSNFTRAWEDGHFGPYLRSSAIVVVAVVSVATLLSIMSGYAFALMRFRGAQVLFYLLLLGLMVPFEALIVPLYYGFIDVGLYNTYWALILPQIGTSVAFGSFWMRAFFRTVPHSVVEAARLDGASSWLTLWRVLLPLARPAILTMVVLLFMWTWNEFLLALVMVDTEDLRTAPLGLGFFVGRNTRDLTLLSAGAVIVALPVVIVYAFLQRHFIRGMVAGAVKG